MKIVLDFFLGGEITSSRHNMSLGVSNSIHVFYLWDWCTSKGNIVVECACLLSFKNYSFVTGSGETYPF
jgi:hypothetical protein